jgi:hypothetical protein
MALFIKLICAPEAATGLCRTCTWGTVRKGFRPAEAEVFCRLVGPNSRVRYAVRECSSYIDRHAHLRPPPRRRYGFVTEIKLEDGSKIPVGSNERSAKPVGDGMSLVFGKEGRLIGFVAQGYSLAERAWCDFRVLLAKPRLAVAVKRSRSGSAPPRQLHRRTAW